MSDINSFVDVENTRQITIGVPTYNRSTILKQFLEQLAKDTFAVDSKIEVIISDNCSLDSTQSICEEWIEAYHGNMKISYFRNSENIGASRNLLSIFDRVTTPYFMFLGDDDRINPESLPKLLAILESPARPVAVIQSCWAGEVRLDKNGAVDFHQALNLFYEYGNAWAAVIDAKAAVKAMNSRNLRAQVESLVWPQTVIGYLAMHDEPRRPVYIVPFEMGTQLVAGMNICTKSYWQRSFHDLLRAAVLIDEAIGADSVKRAFARVRVKGFMLHIKSIDVGTLANPDAEPSWQLHSVLKKYYGLRGRFWSLVIYCCDQSSWLVFWLRTYYRFVKGNNAIEFNEKLMKLRLAHNPQYVNDNVVRHSNWF
jgi:glycosyltransferase involved in cell wall biosynthesis